MPDKKAYSVHHCSTFKCNSVTSNGGIARACQTRKHSQSAIIPLLNRALAYMLLKWCHIHLRVTKGSTHRMVAERSEYFHMLDVDSRKRSAAKNVIERYCRPLHLKAAGSLQKYHLPAFSQVGLCHTVPYWNGCVCVSNNWFPIVV